ncbi:SMC-Scp complex subunit ScpB [Tomitella biformata]|uniref:SMC-Scp complex subunit ScpB n=1 Tax=Tomitella biformata TaxID=630403 RepID=UPI000465E364|nr:SMC-Scp complex subunit ScpB [Tomitella biformata]
MSDETAAAQNPSDGITDSELDAILESLILVIDSPAPASTLADVLEVTEGRVTARLRAMSQSMTDRNSGFDLRFVGDGWRLFTRIEYAGYVERLLLDGSRSTLTRAALETLAVVAYRQPVTRARVGAVRGVNVDGVMRTLLARGLITEAGTDPDSHGVMYSTTEMFLERLGLASLADLPALAPLLPDVDVIEYISENLDSEPRMQKLNTRGPHSGPGDEPTENDVNSSE